MFLSMTEKAPGNLYVCSFDDLSGHPSSGIELLNTLPWSFSTSIKNGSRKCTHCFYSHSREEAEAILRRIKKDARQWKKLGTEFTGLRIDPLRKEDWAESWKKHFRPAKIGRKLFIRPGWSNERAPEGRRMIRIDPGMSFGTGLHATTKACLLFLEDIADERPHGSFFDAGCGSGILSIAAVRLGFGAVGACDMDPSAVACTKENIRKNDICADRIDVFQADIRRFELENGFDAVCANILSGILLEAGKNITRIVKPGGFLVLAGILKNEYDNLSSAFQNLGFREIRKIAAEEWQAGLFLRLR